MKAGPIIWQDTEPESKPEPLAACLAHYHWSSAIAFVGNACSKRCVYLSNSCDAAIHEHLRGDIGELGGLLLGKVFSIPFQIASSYRWITVIEHAIPSLDYRNSSVSLRMGPEVWSRASEKLQNGAMVVGWYHSHPNLGAFFSGTDRATQAAFFTQPYALGLVIDHVRQEQKCFFGPESIELPSEALKRIKDC